MRVETVRMEETEKTFADYLAIIKRRRGPLVVVASAVLILALAVAFGLPPVYRSKAVILIEQQEIPQDLVPTTVTSFADQRIQMISQRVMTSSNLLDIIKKYDLYAEDREKAPLEVVIDGMREDIEMQTVSADVVDPKSGRPTQATIAFTLSYESRFPDLAQKVANELVSLYLNENLKTRTEVATQTSKFLSEEAEKLKARVAELETRLAAFKEKNVGKLPEMMNINLELMDRSERDLVEVDRAISSLEERRIYLQSELAKLSPNSQMFSETGERILGPADRLKVLRTEYLSMAARYSPDHPDVVRLKKEIEALDAETGGTSARGEIEVQLKGLRAELAELRKKYSAEHPDVIKLGRTVESLEKELAAAPPPRRTAPAEEPDNPAYIQLLANLEGANSEIASLREKQKELRAKIAAYERRLNEAPQVEREYRELTRDYETASAKYQEITTKQMAAQVSQTLETERKGERFTLIEPPLLPEQPAKPNRLAIVLIGVMLSFAGGFGSVAMTEAMDPTIRGRRMVTELLGVAPLATIPYIDTAADVRGRAMTSALFFSGAVLTIALCLIAVHLFFMPLDVLWYAAFRRFGF